MSGLYWVKNLLYMENAILQCSKVETLEYCARNTRQAQTSGAVALLSPDNCKIIRPSETTLRSQLSLAMRSSALLRRALPGPFLSRMLATARRANEEALRAGLVELRLVCDQGKQLGIMTPRAALSIAHERQHQLVEVNPEASPPVWRLFQSVEEAAPEPERPAQNEKGKWKKAEKAPKERKLKEVRMSDRSESHDVTNKIRLVQQFLDKDKIVKLVAVNTGRKDGAISRAESLLLKIVEACSEQASSSGISGRRDTEADGKQILGVVTTMLTPKGPQKRK